ncbi:flagellin [Sporosarcina sp. OR05]|uniref:flagellin N-terminal helical domain-containing protein n=1 Tax=Sporosarcina sp. OR05 TaxID=2969819 RepID=UPI00352ACDAA
MRINHNIAALNTHRQLGANNTQASKNLEKLSSGLKINRAGDDAAGLAISEKMRGQIRGLDMASKNAQDSISLIQTAEGALNETHDILQRMRELAVQSSNDTNTATDRSELQKEVDQLAQELSRISNDTEFNTQNLAGGNFKGTFHIGSNEGQSINLSINAMDAASLGVARDVTETTGNASGDLSNVKVGNSVGGAIVDGASVTVTQEGVAATQSTGNLGTDADISATAGGKYDGAAGNGIKVQIVASAGATAGSSLSGDTLTITLDSAGTLNKAAVDAALTAGGFENDFTFTGTGTVANGNNTTLATGADAKVTLTLNDGTNNQTVDVKLDAKEVSIESGAFAGLTFNVTGLDSTAVAGTAVGSIEINSEVHKASAATFDANGKMTKAAAKGGIDISNQTSADSAITTIQTAIDTVSAERSKLGAMQNRLEHTINNLGTSSENLTAAESRIRDVDYVLAAA